MNRRVSRLLAIIIVMLAFATALLLRESLGTAAPREDLQAFAHWTFSGETAADQIGKLGGTIQGKPKAITEPTTAIEFQSPDQFVLIHAKITPQEAFLPKQDMTICSWVRIDEPTEWGGILSCIQDNGSNEAGVILGYDKSRFYFGLASQGKKGTGNFGTMTYLTGKTKYELGRWYHVAATYDGKTMKLFVNGQQDQESNDQSGPVLYAPSAPLVLARYRDEDEDYAFQGAIREIIWSAKSATAEQIRKHYEADAQLAQAAAPVLPPRFIVEPYLQFATRTSMTIMAETPTPAQATVYYGTTFPPKQTVTMATPATIQEVVLKNLQPKTKYYYRMECEDAEGKKYLGKPSTFFTAVDPTDAFSFAVIGDTQRNPTMTGKVAKLMWERRPNFVLHMGDVVDNGPDKKQWTDELFLPCQELFSRVPVYPCIGNHEKNHEHYYNYFSLPKPEYYYTYTYGNIQFFVLDTNKDVSEKSEQYLWLEKALAASDATWKICYHHHPLYSSDSDDFGDTNKLSSTYRALRHTPLIGLYEKYNVDLVMNGHIHVYERTHPIRANKVDRQKGITYITTGGGGARLENFEPTPAFFKKMQLINYHYCYFTVEGNKIEAKVYDHESRLFDQFELTKDR